MVRDVLATGHTVGSRPTVPVHCPPPRAHGALSHPVRPEALTSVQDERHVCPQVGAGQNPLPLELGLCTRVHATGCLSLCNMSDTLGQGRTLSPPLLGFWKGSIPRRSRPHSCIECRPLINERPSRKPGWGWGGCQPGRAGPGPVFTKASGRARGSGCVPGPGRWLRDQCSPR